MFKKESIARYALTTVIFIVAYSALAWVAQLLAAHTGQISVIWPAAGLAMALVIIFGIRYWPAIFLGCFLVHLTLTNHFGASLGMAIGNTLEAVIAAMLLRYWNFSEPLRRISDVMKFIVAAVFFGPGVSASISAIVLGVAGLVDFQYFLPTFVDWLVGDAMGVLLLTPLILSLRERKYREILFGKYKEAIAILGVTFLAALFIFSRQGTDSLALLHLKFLIFPFVVWAAVALSQLGVSISVFIVGSVAAFNTLTGSGHLGGAVSHDNNLVLLHVFMFFGATAAMLLAAAVNETGIAKDQITESERRYRQLVELSPDAIFIQSEGRFIFLNTAAVKMFGAHRPEDLIGRAVIDFAHQDYARTVGHRMKQFVEQKITRIDRVEIQVEAAAVPFVYEGKPAAQVIMRDIRARKEAEQKLKLSMESIERERARDEALLESIAEGVVAIDTSGRVIYMNNQAEQLLGYHEEELLGRVFNEVLPAEDEKGAPIPSNKRPLYLAVTTRKRTASASDYIISKDKTKIPVLATAAPVVLEGRVVGAIGTYRDITKEKEIEKAKSEFISLASHQLRSPLTAFKWVIELLRKEKKIPKKIKEKIDYLYTSNDRLITLVNDLLSVSRIDVGTALVHKQPSDVKKLITDMVTIFKPYAEARKQKIKLDLKIELVNSILDPNLFSEAFKNLLDNAIFYGPQGSEVSVSIDQKGMEYVISIHNDGPPIAEQDKAKLFTRFYRGVGANTQKPTGSGLGLFIAKSSVEANGGKVWFESGAKQGTTFYFTVPITS